MTRLLQEMIEAVERIKRDYPDVPVRFEFATDLWMRLRNELPEVTENEFGPVDADRFFHVYSGVLCFIGPTLQTGEWGPVFRARG